MRQVLLYQDEDGVWIAEVPSLTGCHSCGDTIEEAIENVKDAIRTWIAFLKDQGEPIPPESHGTMLAYVDDESTASTDAA